MAYSATLLLLSFVVGGSFAYPLDNKQSNGTSKESFRPVPLPTDFGSYDPDANGYIDLEELAEVTGTTLDDARKPFMDADIDDDDQVSPSEFERAPWSFTIANREDLISEENEDDRMEDDNDDDDDESIFDNSEDMLVPAGESTTQEDDKEDDKDKSSVETLRESEDEIPEEPLEDDDNESRNLDIDDDETDDNDEEEEEEVGDSDPLLDDDLLREETVLSEDEFVENAIY